MPKDHEVFHSHPDSVYSMVGTVINQRFQCQDSVYKSACMQWELTQKDYYEGYQVPNESPNF